MFIEYDYECVCKQFERRVDRRRAAFQLDRQACLPAVNGKNFFSVEEMLVKDLERSTKSSDFSILETLAANCLVVRVMLPGWEVARVVTHSWRW